MGMFDFLSPKKPSKSINTTFMVNEKELLAKGLSQSEVTNIISAAKLENQVSGQPLFKIQEATFGTNPFEALKQGFFPRQTVRSYVQGAFNLSAALTALWAQALTSRRNYLLISAEIRRFYIVEQLLNVIASDTMGKDQKGDILKFTSEIPKVQEELDELQQNIDFNVILQDFIHNFIDYGEYSLRMKVDPGKGIVAIKDDLDQQNMIALYEQGWPKNYLHFVKTDKGTDWVMEGADYAAHFIMGNAKIRVALVDQLSQDGQFAGKYDLPVELREKLPEYVKVGKPLFYGVIPKLRELQMLEILIPATKLNQVTQTQIIGINIPAATSQDQVIDILRRYEDALNIPLAQNTDLGQLTMSEIMTSTGKVRAFPIFDDGKGKLESLNVRDSKPVDDILAATWDIRKIILSALGVPMSLVYGTAGGTSEGKEPSAEMRLFGRYTRRIADIQESLCRGFAQIIATHLINRGYKNVTYNDFSVKFLKPLADVGQLEYAEIKDAEQELAGRSLDFLHKLEADEFVGPYIDRNVMMDLIQKRFNTVFDGAKIFTKVPNNQAMNDIGQSKPGLSDNDGEVGGDPERGNGETDTDRFKSSDDVDDTKHTFGLDDKSGA